MFETIMNESKSLETWRSHAQSEIDGPENKMTNGLKT